MVKRFTLLFGGLLVFLFLTEVLLFGFAVLIFLTQVLMPAYRGTPLFPFFRKERGLSIKLAEERQKLVEKQIEKTIKKMKEKK